MRPIIVVPALLALLITAFSTISHADQCPEGAIGCLMCGDTPCMDQTDPVICPGQVYSEEPAWGPIAWVGGTGGCLCFCPYSLVVAYNSKDKCAGNSCTFGCNADTGDCNPNPCDTANCQYGCDQSTGQCKPDPCAGKTCPTTCSGTTMKRGFCDSQTGDCGFDTGYCQNGCNAAGTDCATNVPTPEGWKQNDEACDTPKGENCDNSRADCACLSGFTCNLSAPDAHDDGCAPVIGFDCNDNVCDISKGENCASCGGNDAPCACGDYETCSPTATGSDQMGCAMTSDSPCKSCEESRCDVAPFSPHETPKEFSVTKIGCISGECMYSTVECPGGCDSGTNRCKPPASVSADGCVEDGTYSITSGGQSGSSTIRRQTVDSATAMTVKDGSKHCAGDLIATDENTKVWVKHGSGRITYVGPRSVYTNDRITPNTDIASGQIQEKNTLNTDPGAVTDDEKGVVTLVPLEIGVDISKGSDYAGRPMVGNLKTLMDPRMAIDKKLDTLMTDMWVDYLTDYYGMPKWMGENARRTLPSYVKQHSDVLYYINDSGMSITVLEGQATVVDATTNQTVVVSPGESYSKPADTSPTEGTKTTADVAGIHDNIADIPGGTSNFCGPAAMLFVVLAGSVLGIRRR